MKTVSLSEIYRVIAGHSNYHGDSILAALTCIAEGKEVSPIKPIETVEPVRGKWIYWKEQCEYCMNRSTCTYPENQESMESLKKWEKENKFWGSLKLICDYYVLDKEKYYLDNPPECNAER